MRGVRLAEQVLSLFTTPARAASLAGDFLEAAGTRRALWFWSTVLRTALALLWMSFSEAPLALAGVAFLGIFINIGLMLAGVLALFATGEFLLISKILPDAITPVPWGWAWTAAIIALAVGFTTGRWIGRRAPGREVAGCIAFLLIQMLVAGVVRTTHLMAGTPEPLPPPDLLSLSGLFVGAIRVRLVSQHLA